MDGILNVLYRSDSPICVAGQETVAALATMKAIDSAKHAPKNGGQPNNTFGRLWLAGPKLGVFKD